MVIEPLREFHYHRFFSCFFFNAAVIVIAIYTPFCSRTISGRLNIVNKNKNRTRKCNMEKKKQNALSISKTKTYLPSNTTYSNMDNHNNDKKKKTNRSNRPERFEFFVHKRMIFYFLLCFRYSSVMNTSRVSGYVAKSKTRRPRLLCSSSPPPRIVWYTR